MAFKPSIAGIAAALIFVIAAFSASAQQREVVLVGLGDSLMAGYQLPQADSLTAKLAERLKAEGLPVRIENAAVSGDTSQGGLSRVDWSVPDGTDGVILELGANDALRGIAPEQTEKNLEQIVTRLKARGIHVMLVGMLAPPNMGGDYAERFNRIYPRLAEEHDLVFYPFVLDGVVTEARLKLEDGMHPNADGVAVMAERMAPAARKLVEAILSDSK